MLQSNSAAHENVRLWAAEGKLHEKAVNECPKNFCLSIVELCEKFLHFLSVFFLVLISVGFPQTKPHKTYSRKTISELSMIRLYEGVFANAFRPNEKPTHTKKKLFVGSKTKRNITEKLEQWHLAYINIYIILNTINTLGVNVDLGDLIKKACLRLACFVKFIYFWFSVCSRLSSSTTVCVCVTEFRLFHPYFFRYHSRFSLLSFSFGGFLRVSINLFYLFRTTENIHIHTHLRGRKTS